MPKMPAYYADGVPVFIGESYFAPGENVFIQMSTENIAYVGVPHKHTFIEIVYVVSGSATHEANGKCYQVKKGDLVIVNYETIHAFHPYENEKDPFQAYDLMFMPDFFDVSAGSNDLYGILSSSFLFYSISQDEPLGPDLHCSSLSFSEIDDIFKKIYAEYHQRKRGYLALIRAYVIELIIKIFREMENDSRGISSRQIKIVDATLKYLHENYSNPLSVEDLASNSFFSKEYLGRIFKNVTGKTVSAMLQKIRVEEACALLSSTDRIISDIAKSCGFNDMKFFYNTFRKLTGMTPGEYRQKHTESFQQEE